MVPCNYEKIAVSLCDFLRKVCHEVLTYMECSSDAILAAQERIQLVTGTLMSDNDGYGKLLTSNPTLNASRADVCIHTYSIQCGVSIDNHFVVRFTYI